MAATRFVPKGKSSAHHTPRGEADMSGLFADTAVQSGSYGDYRQHGLTQSLSQDIQWLADFDPGQMDSICEFQSGMRRVCSMTPASSQSARCQVPLHQQPQLFQPSTSNQAAANADVTSIPGFDLNQFLDQALSTLASSDLQQFSAGFQNPYLHAEQSNSKKRKTNLSGTIRPFSFVKTGGRDGSMTLQQLNKCVREAVGDD